MFIFFLHLLFSQSSHVDGGSHQSIELGRASSNTDLSASCWTQSEVLTRVWSLMIADTQSSDELSSPAAISVSTKPMLIAPFNSPQGPKFPALRPALKFSHDVLWFRLLWRADVQLLFLSVLALPLLDCHLSLYAWEYKNLMLLLSSHNRGWFLIKKKKKAQNSDG